MLIIYNLFYIQRFNRTLAVMKLKMTFFLLLSSFFVFAQAESETTELIDEITINADTFIGYDKFDFLYFIKDNALFKVKDHISVTYKNLALGQITKVDLLNPLKIIVFYERFNTAVTLDNQLNETLKINFSELKTPLVVSKIGIASQNQLWVFDEITSQLYLYDTGNGTLKSVGTPLSESIVFYNSDFNYFEWMDKSKNWYQCSVFGTVKKLDYAFNFDSILYSDNEQIFYKKEGKVLIFNRNTIKISSIENIDKTFKSLTFKNQILSIFTNKGISNFKITKP